MKRVHGVSDAVERGIDDVLVFFLVFIHRRVHFDEQGAGQPADLDRLVHDLDLRADRNLIEQLFDILRQHAYAAVGHTHADTEGLVGAVNQVAWKAEPHGESAQGVVRPRRHDIGQDFSYNFV